MKPAYIYMVGGLFILGLILGYSIYAVTDKYECQLRRDTIQNCIDQSNKLLDIVVERQYCHKAIDLDQFNFTFVLPEGFE